VLAAPFRRSGLGFVLKASTNQLTGARLGLIAGRRAARRSVDRNRAKRLAREAFRAVRDKLPALDLVLQLRNDLRRRGSAEVRGELDKLLRDVAARCTAGRQ